MEKIKPILSTVWKWIKRIVKSKPGVFIIALIPVLLMCIFPVLFLYAKNPTQLIAAEAFVIIAAYVLIGLIVFLITFLFSKKIHFTSIFSFVFMALFLNFSLIKNLAALFTSDTHILSAIIYLLMLGIVSFLLIKFRKSPAMLSLQKVATIVIVLLTVWNLASTIPFDKWFAAKGPSKAAVNAVAVAKNVDNVSESSSRVLSYEQVKALVSQSDFSVAQYRGKFSSAKSPKTVTAAERQELVETKGLLPNIYWIILDEAGDFHTMKKYYDYDCADIESFLLENNFNISYNTSNRIAMSNEVLADLCSLEYVAKENMMYKTALYYRNNGEIWRVLNELGYDVYQASSEPSYLSSLYDLTKIQREELLFAATTMEGRTQLDLAIDSTPLSIFDISLFQYTVNSKRMRIERVFNYFNDPSNYTFDSSVALFSHIMCPHSPFVFARDGSITPREGHFNWDDTQYYRDQYIYTMNQAKSIISNFIKNDPNCIIILMSDHGPRSRSDARKVMELNLDEDDMRRVLNAVYIGGKQVDIEGLTGVNTMRTVLNELGTDYPMLDNNPDVIPYPYLKKLKKNDEQ